MTISLRGTATGLTGGTTANLAFTLPTGVVTNDLLVAVAGWKPFSTTISSGSLTTEWTSQSPGANGSTANGVDVGSVYAQAWTKVHDGSEGNPSGSLSSAPSPRMSGMIAFQSTVAGSGWDVDSTNGSDAVVTGSTFSATGAADIGYKAGDWALVLVVHKTEAATHTSPSLTISGTTVGTLTQRLATTTTTSGNDGGMFLYTAEIISGTSNLAPVFTVTTGGTNVSDGQVIFLRISDPVSLAPEGVWGTLTI